MKLLKTNQTKYLIYLDGMRTNNEHKNNVL